MATVIVPIRAKDETKAGLSRVRRSFASLGDGIKSGLGIAGGLGIASIAESAIGAMKGAIDSAAEFGAAITNIEARTELTEEGLNAVREQALAMGRDTQFSATQAAEGMLELITSGSSAEEAIQAIPEVLNLAAAAGLGLGHAADGVTDVMAQFGLGVEDAGRVVNAFTQAAGSSSATAADLIDAMKNGGAVASGFGLDVDQAAAAMAVLAENGLKGAEAGTALKSFLLNATRNTDASVGALDRLGIALFGAREGFDNYSDAAKQFAQSGQDISDVSISFYDASGNARNFNDVIAEISEGLAFMDDAQANQTLKDLAGSYGQVAARALVASGGIDEMQETMSQQRTAAEVAQTQMETWQARLDSLGASLETLAIKVMLPFIDNVLIPMVRFLTDGLNAFNAWTDTEDVQAAMAGLVDTFTFLWTTVQNVVSLVGAIFRGDWADAFRIAVRTVVDFVNGVIGLLETHYRAMLTFIQNVLNSMIRFVNDALRGLPDFLKDTVYNLTGGSIDIKQGKLIQEVGFADDFALPRVQLAAFAQQPSGGDTIINVNVRPNAVIGDSRAIASDVNELIRRRVVQS